MYNRTLDYDKASELAMKARDHHKGYKMENNTRLINMGSHFSVRLHRTNVVDLYHDGSYVIRTGGWYSVTTKNRINKYTPQNVYVYQEDFEWFISHKNGETPFFEDAKFNEEGELLNG